MLASAVLLAAAIAGAAPKPGSPTAVTVTGVVLDSEGRPVPGVAIGVMRADRGAFDLFDVPFLSGKHLTDRAGAFRILVEPGDVALIAQRVRGMDGPPEEASVTLRLTPAAIAPGGARVVVRLDGTASIRGRALDPEGRPLGGVRVTVIPEPTGAAARRGDATSVRVWTRDDGTFLAPGLAPGEHRLLARGDGFNCVEACEYGKGMRVRTGAAPVNVPLAPTGRVFGRVLERNERGALVPVERFTVWSPAFGTRYFEVEGGAFEIDVPRLWANARLFVVAPELTPFGTTFDLPGPIAVDLGDVVLDRGRTVRGTVRDGSGRPVEDAMVRVGYATGSLEKPHAVSDAAGRFEIEVASGTPTPLNVSHPRFRPQDVTAEPAARHLEVALTAGTTLTVRTEEPDGTPIEGVRVWSVISRSQCNTGADGSCVLSGLEDREHILEFRARGAPRPAMRQLRVPRGAGGSVLVRLPRLASELVVTVLEPGGTFGRGSVVVIQGPVSPAEAIGPGGVPERPYYAGAIDLEKRFENLPPGPYTIVAREGWRCAVRTVQLEEGAELRLGVELPGAGGPCR